MRPEADPECATHLLILLSPLVSTAARLLPAFFTGPTGQDPPKDFLGFGVGVMVHTQLGISLSLLVGHGL